MSHRRQYIILAIATTLLGRASATKGESSTGLTDTLRGLLGQLENDSAQPTGAIAKVSGNKVYINLGSASGIEKNDTLDIVRTTGRKPEPANSGHPPATKREVVGRLKVATVQEKLSICELIEGKAEERDSEGRLNAVIPSRDSGRYRVALGPVKISPDVTIGKQEVRDAMAAAATAAGWPPLAPPGQAPLELSVSMENTPAGCSIELRLEDRQNRRAAQNARGVLRTGLRASDYGFRSGLEGNLGVVLKMDPVKKALQTLGSLAEIGDVLVLVKAGSRGESVWVFPDSRIVVASHTPLNAARQTTQLSLVWHNVGRAIDSVSADLSATDVEVRLRASCEFFTEIANQMQMLQVEMTAGALKDLILAWPDAQSTWSELLCTGSGSAWYPNQVTIDDKPVVTNNSEQVASGSLARIVYGDHHLAATNWTGGNVPMIFRISAFFEKPNGQITLSDQAGKNMATRSVYSRLISELVLPGNPELLRLATQPSAQGPGGVAKKPALEREPPEKLKERLEAANTFLKNQQYDKARTECYTVLREAPASAEAAEARKLIQKINETQRRRPATPRLRR
ncbi:MAG: hypothetical protein KA354_17160 [Phycisphaerae bacterium]|nr:hypothetical protein [Phycisphaerae bacterium]